MNDANTSKPLVYMVRVREALSRSGLPDLDYALNPYMGCWHACIYCYARLYTRVKDVAENWGEIILVKENIVDLLRREVRKKKPGIVGVGTITDAYQPVEAVYGLTRKSIQVLLEHEFHASIQTKNPLVLRDLDILKKYKSRVDVGFTITTLDGNTAKIIEPRAPPPKARAQALEKIAREGIETWLFYGPIIPGLNDDEETILSLLELAKQTNSIFYYDKLRVKKFMENPGHPLYAIARRARRYPWRRLYERIEEKCKKHKVKCMPGMEYKTIEKQINTLDKYLFSPKPDYKNKKSC